MTLSLPRFAPRSGTVGAAVAAMLYTSLTFGAAIAPAPAQASTGAYYTAELAAPAKDSRYIGGGLVWRCEGTTCAAPKGTSRPEVVCRKLQREVGQIASFRANGETLEGERLAKCNGN
jgi:hypothetical protein